MLAALRADLTSLKAQLQLQPVVTFLVAGVGLCLYHYASIAPLLQKWLVAAGIGDEELCGCIGWNLSAGYCLVLLPLLVRAVTAKVAREPASPSGWGLGNWRLGLTACALFALGAVAISAYGSLRPDFQNAYPLCGAARHSWRTLLAYDISFALYFIAWESFFRGFLTLGLEKPLGIWTAFVQMLPFVVIHFDKPFLEALTSILGGVLLALLALRTRSFWYGAFIHSVLAIGMDLMVTARLGWR
jgi:membrane protease YdiL (CAAX protease family)